MHLRFKRRRAFTLIELLVVVAIISILAVVVILTINPPELLRQGRDSSRLSDMATLTSALGVYTEDQGSASLFSMGSSNVIYISIPDPTATSTQGDQCQGLGLISLPATYSYHCSATSTYRRVNGTGWIPVNFSAINSGSPLGDLPFDPTNQSSSRFYYTYTTNGAQYEVTAAMESQKYKLAGSKDAIGPDGSVLSTVYAKGTNLALEPLDYGDSSLVGLWSFSEGTGTVAYDYSGSNATGSWVGTQVGTNGYYSVGKIGSYAGAFDGSTDSLTANDANLPSGASAFTKFVWVYLPNGITSMVYADDIVGWGTIGSNSETNILRTGNANQLLNYFWSNDFAWYSSHIVNGWNNIAVTFDGSTERGYINGVYESSYAPSTPNVTLTTITIGGKIYSGDNAFSGLLDDIRIYNRALSAAEITAMYNGGK